MHRQSDQYSLNIANQIRFRDVGIRQIELLSIHLYVNPFRVSYSQQLALEILPAQQSAQQFYFRGLTGIVLKISDLEQRTIYAR